MVDDSQTPEEILVEKIARALMDVQAPLPCSDGTQEFPVIDGDPDFDDLPRDHTEGTRDDFVTQDAVLRLARAALRVVREETDGG